MDDIERGREVMSGSGGKRRKHSKEGQRGERGGKVKRMRIQLVDIIEEERKQFQQGMIIRKKERTTEQEWKQFVLVERI